MKNVDYEKAVSKTWRHYDLTARLTPWEGHFRHFEEKEGMRIPVEGDVEWRLPDGSFPYWKGRIVKVMYDFADDLPPVKKTGGTSHE
ncbi:MAG: hypothetical protein HY204_11005 [Nitrospirae bacterium]|nr:hypothetical protein [Nitrospirota bacterium]